MIGLALLGLYGGIQKAKAEKAAGYQRWKTAQLNAIEVGYEKKQAKVKAQNAHNFRMQEYLIAKSQNVSFDGFRNVEGQSVEAYQKRNRETVLGDVGRKTSDLNYMLRQQTRQQVRLKDEGEYYLKASNKTAMATMLNSGMNFYNTAGFG